MVMNHNVAQMVTAMGAVIAKPVKKYARSFPKKETRACGAATGCGELELVIAGSKSHEQPMICKHYKKPGMA